MLTFNEVGQIYDEETVRRIKRQIIQEISNNTEGALEYSEESEDFNPSVSKDIAE
jgi:hypothetical protein